ncbi:MAG: glycosyltransferase family 2 protein [Rhodospirillaceae bacterium]|nr:glycosyltransferase family 2 protein [Rhodospirillaceae bacterium]
MPAGDRPPLSCYIRTLNEEVRIGATVRAALHVAREVVVVDSGSTDGTVAVAEAEGARIIEQAWLGGGHQKRVGEDACRYDWLLNLDADEIISDMLAQQIRDVFAAGEPDADVYILPVVIVDPAGRIWRRARANPRARLYDRRKVRMPAHAVWDQFPIPAGLRTRRLGGFLLHHAFDDLAHLSRKQGSAMVRRVRFLENERPLSTALRVYFGLPYFFFRSYVIRGRWMEGGYGFLLSMVTAYNHWFKFAMLHEKRLKGQDSKESSDRPG